MTDNQTYCRELVDFRRLALWIVGWLLVFSVGTAWIIWASLHAADGQDQTQEIVKMVEGRP